MSAHFSKNVKSEAGMRQVLGGNMMPTVLSSVSPMVALKGKWHNAAKGSYVRMTFGGIASDGKGCAGQPPVHALKEE